MSADTITAKVGGITLTIPVYETPEKTLELTDLVNRRFSEIARKGKRVDTQVFALETAISFAIDLAKANTEWDQERESFHEVLDTIAGKLRDALPAQTRIRTLPRR